MFQLFTQPDTSLSSETSIDPMGLQVVWTHYARGIYEDKVSTLITDARILTINLFHAYLLNELHENNTLANLNGKFSKWISDRDIRFGILMLLEDLCMHIFYENYENKNIDTRGLIGMQKASQVHRASNNIQLRADQSAGILTNQIQLGMMGRNKGGMMSMGIFNGDLLFQPAISKQINSLFSEWKEAVSLKERLTNYICNEVLKATGNKQVPVLEYKTKSLQPLSNGYIALFGKRSLSDNFRSFWIDRLGFNSGAANAVYNAIDTLFSNNSAVNPQTVMEHALGGLTNEPGEQEKIDIIIRIEPFLSICDYTFRFIAQRDVKRISDHADELTQLRKQIEKDGHEDRLRLNAHNYHPSLKELNAVMMSSERSLKDWVSDIIKYHKKIMERRKNAPWIELHADDTLKHIQTATLPEEYNRVDEFLLKRPWFNRYYLDSVQSLREFLKQ
jgi:hypothetical protein